MQAQVVGIWLSLCALVVLAGCGGSSGPSCGPGTSLVGGACVATGKGPTCGAGTVQSGRACVPLKEDASADTNPGSDAAADADSDAAADTAADAAIDAVADSADLPVIGPDACTPTCAPTETCVGGVCEPLPIPAAWNCAKTAFADGQTCECGCGAVDPDCGDAAKPVVGCKSAGACQANGACPVCAPSCAGKVCGDDGCGGVCGACVDPDKPSCSAGTCVACVPACSGKTCGDDGCGGSCGACAAGQLCAAGTCAYPSADQSCNGHCGGLAPAGCACTAGCASEGTCCVDVGVCGCVADCNNKSCGDDGCGGSCGACGAGTVCTSGQCQIVGGCDNAMCNGHGQCNAAGNACVCQTGYAGAFCDACTGGLVGYPTCVPPCADVTQCDDASACTLDVCSPAAGCLHIAVSCDDGNQCTADLCNAASGCSDLPAAATVCEDDDACTGTGSCNAGTCVGGAALNCDDGNACSLDTCDAKAGCVHSNTDAPCEDGDACSLVSVCINLACTSLGGVNCDDGNPCTQDLCASQTAVCSHPPASAGAVCDDDDLCTSGDFCDGQGGCNAGAKVCALTVTSGLVAHYSAAQVNTLAYGEDKVVQAWQDQSGQGHGLSAVDGANAPLLDAKAIHGRRGVRMSGAAGLHSAAFNFASSISVFGVICSDSSGDLGTVATQGGGWTIGGSSGSLAWKVGAGGGGPASAVKASACYVAAARAAAGSIDLTVIDTTSKATTDTATLAPGTQPLVLGADGAAVVLGELLVYDHALTDVERDSVATYLRTAWGFEAPQPDFAWYDATDTASVQRDAQNLVTGWLDKSGLGRDALVGVDSAPHWYALGTSSGQPAIRFDGGTVRLQTAPVAASANLTVFTVFELDNPQAWGTVIAQGANGAFALRKTETAPSTLQWQTAANPNAPQLPYVGAQWQVLTALQDGTQCAAYTDSAAVQSAQGPGIAAASAKLSLGNSQDGGASMGGFIAEIRAYASALAPTDRAFIAHLLHVKYGL